MSIDDDAKLLSDYIQSLHDFKFFEPPYPYGHMGATITDAMLQAGTTWETVVKPRVENLRLHYPEAKTTMGFFHLLQSVGPRELLRWNDPEKPNRVLGLTSFFVEEGTETEAELKNWLEDDANIARLKRLRGIGNKTSDYLKMLSGIPTCAVDIHLIRFLNNAGIEIDINKYLEARKIINRAADLMGVNKSILDNGIWKYMSEVKVKKICRTGNRRSMDNPCLRRFPKKETMPRIWTLGHPSKRTQFDYTGDVDNGVILQFSGNPRISSEFFKAILNEFRGRRIAGGFSMTDPVSGGLGEWLQNNSNRLNPVGLTPRHATFIAAILAHEGFITSDLDGNTVYLDFP